MNAAPVGIHTVSKRDIGRIIFRNDAFGCVRKILDFPMGTFFQILVIPFELFEIGFGMDAFKSVGWVKMRSVFHTFHSKPTSRNRNGKQEAYPSKMPLRQHIMHNIPKHIRQSKIATRMAVGQSFMVKPQGIQHRCMQIVHMNRGLRRRITKIIG